MKNKKTKKIWNGFVISLLCVIGTGACSAADSPEKADSSVLSEARLQAVPFTQVKITSDFWGPKRDTNRLASIAANLDNLEKAGNIGNFKLAAQGKHEGYKGPLFMDSDLYKGLEAAAYTLATDYTPELDAEMDRIIQIIASAQGSDGYLNTYFTVVEPDRRWKNLRDAHELYCAGHLFEAAVAHYQATNKKNFLNVAIKLADCIDSVFGDEPGKRAGYAGHPEIELALVKLWKATGNDRYLKLARFFTVHRGEKFFAKEHNIPMDQYVGDYHQDKDSIYDTTSIMGHAVRAAYLLSGCVDIGRETQDEELLRMVRRVWKNTVHKNLYITGGIGPSAHNEGFTEDYDLPNASAYQETCASVAMILLNHRLGLLYGDAKYADVLERTLYNGFISGVNLEGNRFFYVNPLESSGSHHRSSWFGCACCPPNVARLMASLGEYLYATGDNSLYVNQFVQGSFNTEIKGKPVKMHVETDYPWDGKVKFIMDMDDPVEFDLFIRIPSWAQNVSKTAPSGSNAQMVRGYEVYNRVWKKGDTITYNFKMKSSLILAHPNVKADDGMVAIQRGPVVYCLEEMDQESTLKDIYLPPETKFTAKHDKKLLGGVTVLEGDARYANLPVLWLNQLYQPFPGTQQKKVTKFYSGETVAKSGPTMGATKIKAIPYYAWDNRKASPMKVWLPMSPRLEALASEGMEGAAKVTLSFTSNNCYPDRIRDGQFPKKSNQHPGQLTHFWPHKGGEEWVSYTWDAPVETTTTRVYWFDDTGVGECRPPVSWLLEYQDEQGLWKAVNASTPYSVELDKWIEITHKPVVTKAMRVKVKQQDKFAVGIHEWQVIPLD